MEDNWININTEKDIEEFLVLYGYFHDSCIKEVKYESGMYVDKELRMKAVNDKRKLSVVFQRQWKNPTTIEVVFESLVCLHLEPVNECYDGSIFCASLIKQGDSFFWIDDDISKDTNIDEIISKKEEYTWIKAEKVKYRIVEQYLGQDMIYINSK